MRDRVRLLRLILLVLLVWLVMPSPARSASSPTCTFSGEVVLEPGLSTVPGSGTFETERGREGTYRCAYRYGPAKTGRVGAEGTYGTAGGDTCGDGGEGEGRLGLGKDGGENDFTFTYTPFSDDGVATGEFHSERFSGILRLTALDGDCALAPVTRVRLEGRGTLQS